MYQAPNKPVGADIFKATSLNTTLLGTAQPERYAD